MRVKLRADLFDGQISEEKLVEVDDDNEDYLDIVAGDFLIEAFHASYGYEVLND